MRQVWDWWECEPHGQRCETGETSGTSETSETSGTGGTSGTGRRCENVNIVGRAW